MRLLPVVFAHVNASIVACAALISPPTQAFPIPAVLSINNCRASPVQPTDFGTTNRYAPITIIYTIGHCYPGQASTGTLTSVTSSSPDFVVDLFDCGSPLKILNPVASPTSCQIKVTFLPLTNTAGPASSTITVNWTQGIALSTLMNVTGNASVVPCTFDIDGDGATTAMVDAFVFLRAMLGFRDSQVTNGVTFSPSAKRKEWLAAVAPSPLNSISLYLRDVCGVVIP